ncbi:MAG: hypothetical protein OXC70_09530 [Gammaproteobacteria bacterium]|nr:hypothetical protein [Gammaproteobacteria bacterium]
MNPLDSFDDILALLHRAALDDAHWPAASALIEEASGVKGSVLTVCDWTVDQVRVDFARLLYRGELREDLAQEYFEIYQPRDEGPPRLWQRPIGELVNVPDLYTERELRKSPAYNEGWGRRHGEKGLITRLDWLDGVSVVWVLGNPIDTGGWQSSHLELIESLLPHVRHFVRVRQTLAGVEALSAGLSGLLENSSIGVVHLDRAGRVLAANGPALDILRQGDGLSDRDGALRSSLPADQGRLQRLLKRALPAFGSATPPTGGSMTIQRRRIQSRLALHVHPVEAAQPDFGGRRVAVLALVIDPEKSPRIDPVRVASLLGLKPSEGRVSALLAEGRSVREIAAATGYKESYVRWLFKQVYQKQGLSGQIALVKRVLTAHGLPRR